MPLVIVIDTPGGGTARLLAPVLRSGMHHELFHDPDAALRHLVDPFVTPAAHVILIGPRPVAAHVALLESIAAVRSELGPRIILVTENPRDERLATLVRRLGISWVIRAPFGVEDLVPALAGCQLENTSAAAAGAVSAFADRAGPSRGNSTVNVAPAPDPALSARTVPP